LAAGAPISLIDACLHEEEQDVDSGIGIGKEEVEGETVDGAA